MVTSLGDGNLVGDVRTLTVLVTQRPDELEQRLGGPKDEDEEDGLIREHDEEGRSSTTHDKFKHGKDPFVQAGPFEQSLRTDGDSDDESDEEEPKGNQDLGEEGVDVRVLDGRVGVGEQLGRSSLDDKDKDGDDDDSDGLEDVAGEEDEPRSLHLSTNRDARGATTLTPVANMGSSSVISALLAPATKY
jgi:hypothetical protein